MSQTPETLENQLKARMNQAFSQFQSSPQASIAICREVIEPAQTHQLPYIEANALMCMGMCQRILGDCTSAIEHYRQAESIFLRIETYAPLSHLYGNLGLAYASLGKYEQALACYNENIALIEAKELKVELCGTYTNIALVYMKQGVYDKAEQWLTKALQDARKHNNIRNEATVLHNLAAIIRETKDSASALAMFLESAASNERVNNLSILFMTYISIAELLEKGGEYEQAFGYLNKSAKIIHELNLADQKTYLQRAYARYYHAIGDEAKRWEALQEALRLLPDSCAHELKISLQYDIMYAHRDRGEFEEALAVAIKIQDLMRDEFEDKRNRMIQQQAAKLENAQKEAEARVLRQKNTELEEKNREINRQKEHLEEAERKLQAWNHELEQRVQQEVAQRRQQEQIIIQKSKLESMGRMAAGIAHEINQPLGLINLGVQNLFLKLESGPPPAEYIAEKTRYFEENIERIRRIIEHVRVFSREQQAGVLEPFDVKQTVEGALTMLEVQYGHHNITIERSYADEPCRVLGSPHRFEQVMLNLLQNARDALDDQYDEYDDRRRIIIRVLRQGGRVITEVEDNGAGIPPELAEHVFEPFFTTKGESAGTGLGLSICYGIVQEMNGDIRCESEPGSHTRIVIELEALSE